MKILGKMKKHQYWEWRFKLADMQLREKEYLAEFRNFQLMEKDLELARLRMLSFKSGLSDVKAKADLAKKEYEELLASLEKEIGASIKGNAVDEVTFEIKQLEN